MRSRSNSPKRELSLQWLLTVPFVVLLVVQALALGVLVYQASARSIDRLAESLSKSLLRRIGQTLIDRVNQSEAVLDAAFDAEAPPSGQLQIDIEDFRIRFWIATSIYNDFYNNVYYGNRDGQFIGLRLQPKGQGELQTQTGAEQPRQVLSFDKPTGPLIEAGSVQGQAFDARLRPWYVLAQQTRKDVWTPTYSSAHSKRLVVTRARPVFDQSGELLGVGATDFVLDSLEHFMRTMPISAGGVAFVVDGKGRLVATSRGSSVNQASGGEVERIQAVKSQDPLVQAGWLAVRDAWKSATIDAPTAVAFVDPDGRHQVAGVAGIRSVAGMDWGVVTVVPRDEFVRDFRQIMWLTVIIGGLTALLMLACGLRVLRSITRAVDQLTTDARRIGAGDLHAGPKPQRTHELATLASTMRRMQDRLRTDRLTGLINREAMMQRLQRRINGRRGEDRPLFALLFIDLDGFKRVNDERGHATGDQVLVETALRLRERTRDSDAVCRWAGDEFVMLVDHLSCPEDAEAVRAHVQTAFTEPMRLQGVDETQLVGASIGLAIFPRDAADAERLVRAADADMYRIKQSRPSRFGALD